MRELCERFAISRKTGNKLSRARRKTDGAALVWRAPATATLPILEHYADGSYRSELRWNPGSGETDRTPQPVRVVTADLGRRLPNSESEIYPDAGHGGIFQFHRTFVPRALEFLAR